MIHVMGIYYQGTAYTLKENENSEIDWGSFHKYAGYSTLLLAGATAVSSSNRYTHYGLAYSTVGMAMATLWSGIYEYSDRFDLDEGITSEDNLHIILGIIGTLACLTAVAIADSGKNARHGGIGGTGAGTMVFSFFVIKW
ncbi:MAG: hypothetical protein HQK76_05675 [Desulfobacterales bacterium]|nr:hypothetical protein [Desulfobacterales bacterium]